MVAIDITKAIMMALISCFVGKIIISELKGWKKSNFKDQIIMTHYVLVDLNPPQCKTAGSI